MSSDGRRIGRPTHLELSDEARAIYAKSRDEEEARWRHQSGAARTRRASGEELRRIRAGQWRPDSGNNAAEARG